MSCLFNSYDPYFKQPFGALRAGQTVRLTLCIPEELGYVDPHLVLQKEGKYDVPVHYRMKFDGQTPQQNHFSVELPLLRPLHRLPPHLPRAGQLRRCQLAGRRKVANHRLRRRFPDPGVHQGQGVLSDLPGPVLRGH